MNLREQILAQPAEEQLAYALDMLEILAGQGGAHLFYAQHYGITNQEAQVLAIMLARPSMLHTKAAILGALYTDEPDVGIKFIDVLICKLRAKLKRAGVDGLILTIWGQGYRLDPEKVAQIPEPPVLDEAPRDLRTEMIAPKTGSWTEQEDEDLIRMHQSGSSLWDMSVETGRTERACACRLDKFRLDGVIEGRRVRA